MQASYAGPLASYNSLEDEHLAEYFSNPNTIKHLRKMGLVTKDGRIVNEGTIRRNASQKEHKARTKDLLADAIVRNALEIERKRRALLRNKLEHLANIETVQRVKSQKSHPSWVQEFNPSAVPTIPPLLSETLESHSDQLGLSSDQLFEMRRLVGEFTRDRRVRTRTRNPYESSLWSRSSSPLPLAPRPPSAPRPQTSMPNQSRRLQLTHQNGRPRTAPGGIGTHCLYPSRTQPARSQVLISLRYTGKNLHLEGSYCSSALSEVLILQQHCGGNTVQLYKGRVRPREQFTFESKRHLSMPFGLTIYLDGMMDLRVSTCCEYRHQCGKLLGSRRAHFRLIKVEGGRPCVKCNAEIERREKKDKLHRSLEEAISGPSTENDEELNQLLARNTSAVEAVPPSPTARNTNAVEAVPPSSTARNTNAVEAVPPSPTERNTNAVEAVPPSSIATNANTVEAVPPSPTERNTNAVEAVPPSPIATNANTVEAVPPSTTASPPNSQTQVDKEQEPLESERKNSPEPEQFETDTKDSEVQATEDMYEDDFVKNESVVDSQHSSGSSNSLVNEESKTSSQSHSRSASASSVSSRSSEENISPDIKESSSSLSETKSIPVDASNPNTTPAVNEEYEYDDDVFEEPELEDHVEQQDDKQDLQMESTDPVQEPAMSPIEQTVQTLLITDDLELEQNASENPQPIPENDNSNIANDSATEENKEQALTEVTNEHTDTEITPTDPTVQENLHDPDDPIQAEEEGQTIESSFENETTSSVHIPDQPMEEPPVIISHQSSPQLSLVDIPPENVTTSSSLSASFTLTEAVKAIEKTSSANSLHSILNDNSSKTASSVDLSEPDEDIPNLEQKILELPNPNLIEAASQSPTNAENQQTVQHEISTQDEVNNADDIQPVDETQANTDNEPRSDHTESDASSSHLPGTVESSTATLATEDQAKNTPNNSEQGNSQSQLDNQADAYKEATDLAEQTLTNTETQQIVQNDISTPDEVSNVVHAHADDQADTDKETRSDHTESDTSSSHLPGTVESSTATLATEDQAHDNSEQDTVSQSETESNIEQNHLASSPSPRPSLSSSLTSVSSRSDNVFT